MTLRLATLAMSVGLATGPLPACGDDPDLSMPSVEAPPATRPSLPGLEPAIDLDPAPEVVEIHLEAAAAEVDYRGDGIVTRVMAYRDAGRPGSRATVPGPQIVANVGDTLVVRFTNRMPERTTTVHWHGLRLPAHMDGNPAHSGATYPDQSFEYRFVVRDAGLHWYHPHVDTDQQMELGLYGTLLVRAPGEPEVDVERVLVLDDVDLDSDAQVRLEPDADDIALGRHGDVVLVNGRERPSLVVQAGTTERWRLVNAANGRYFELELAGHRFIVVGGDGGPLAAPYATRSLLIAPGERHDVLLTVVAGPGERVWLRSGAVERGHGEVPSFRLGEDLEHPNGPRFTINDELWPFNKPIVAKLGDLKVWSLENLGDGEHPFHLHGAFFQTGGPPRDTRHVDVPLPDPRTRRARHDGRPDRRRALMLTRRRDP